MVDSLCRSGTVMYSSTEPWYIVDKQAVKLTFFFRYLLRFVTPLPFESTAHTCKRSLSLSLSLPPSANRWWRGAISLWLWNKPSSWLDYNCTLKSVVNSHEITWDHMTYFIPYKHYLHSQSSCVSWAWGYSIPCSSHLIPCDITWHHMALHDMASYDITWHHVTVTIFLLSL